MNLQLNFSPFPELKTERLLLRRLTKADAPSLFFLRSDPRVLKYLGREPAQNLQEVEVFIEKINHSVDQNEAILWGITMAEDPSVLIGTICYWNIQPECYRAETGYVLHPDYWRKGLMKEALQCIIDYGFNKMKLHSIEASFEAANESSAAVLAATGFVKEGYFKDAYCFHGQFQDKSVYSRLQ